MMDPSEVATAMKVFSFGGGVQSTAALVLAAQSDLQVDAFLFANVGDDSEHPDTLRYVREVAMPYAARRGIELIELQRRRKSGEIETLYKRLTRPGSRSIGIPVRMGGSGAPGNRACTADFKIRVIAKWCWQHGARPQRPATTLLGISLDEWRRMRNDSGISYTRLAYPLIDRRMSRQDCINTIARADLPIPPKSACVFCPYHRLSTWRKMRDKQPDLFAKSVELERFINARRAALGKDKVWFSRALKPLDKAVGDVSQPSLFEDDDACESGFCMV